MYHNLQIQIFTKNKTQNPLILFQKMQVHLVYLFLNNQIPIHLVIKQSKKNKIKHHNQAQSIRLSIQRRLGKCSKNVHFNQR